MSTKHTPGPWRVGATDNCLVFSGRATVAVAYMIPGASSEEEEANARLIALAPRLFEYVASSAAAGCATAQALMAELDPPASR